MNGSENSKNDLENEILIGGIRKNPLKHKTPLCICQVKDSLTIKGGVGLYIINHLIMNFKAIYS